jgi:hypothetical protein
MSQREEPTHTRAMWLASLGVALLAYITIGVAQLILFWAASNVFSTNRAALIGLGFAQLGNDIRVQ